MLPWHLSQVEKLLQQAVLPGMDRGAPSAPDPDLTLVELGPEK
jgi:hypothetical protein